MTRRMSNDRAVQDGVHIIAELITFILFAVLAGALSLAAWRHGYDPPIVVLVAVVMLVADWWVSDLVGVLAGLGYRSLRRAQRGDDRD